MRVCKLLDPAANLQEIQGTGELVELHEYAFGKHLCSGKLWVKCSEFLNRYIENKRVVERNLMKRELKGP